MEDDVPDFNWVILDSMSILQGVLKKFSLLTFIYTSHRLLEAFAL